MGVVSFQGFYLPWALLAVNTMLGHSFLPDLLGIIVGHVYYFLTVLHPRNGGQQLLKTPQWLFKLLVKYRIGETPRSAPEAQPPPPATGRPFTGRSYRLNRD
ncbi:unnamed protein product [Calypogeia fissa]